MSIGARYGETNTGRKRRRNEDSFVCEPPLFAVADGMGGAQAGEIASSLAAATLSGALKEGDNITAPAAVLLVVQLIQEANRRVHERATHDSAASGMGTTMTVALVASDGGVAIGHVGDSRAYRLRSGILVQLTDDHSLVAELVRRGELTSRGGRDSPPAIGDHTRTRHRPRGRNRRLRCRRGGRWTSSCSVRTDFRRWSTRTRLRCSSIAIGRICGAQREP
jgi:serine/threonine protein phosphatase PrpC